MKKPIKSQSEVKIYGLQSVLHFIENRRQDTIRAYVTEENVGRFGEFLKWCAKNKKAYHVVSAADLTKIVASKHHEGCCVLAIEQKPLRNDDLLKLVKDGKLEPSQPLVFLDKTANPHNIGAIARSMAHFGIKYLLMDKDSMPKFGGSLARVSKGGSEYIEVIEITEPAKFLPKLFAQGYQAMALAAGGKENIFGFKWPKRLVLLFGHEVTGISKELTALAHNSLSIPGSRKIDSLNVSVSCGIVFSQWYQRLGK